MVKRRSLPKHVSWAKTRHGKMLLRFRRKVNGYWQSRYLPGPPYSDEFNAAYHAELDQVNLPKPEIGASKTIPGTINAAIVAFLQSATYQGIRDSSKKSKRLIIKKIREAHGNKRIALLERRHIQDILNNMSDRPHAANRWLSVLRQILDHAVILGMIRANPTQGVKGYSKKTDGWLAWTEANIEKFKDTHPVGTNERLAFDLLLGTGQRRSDVVRLGWQHVDGNRFKFKQLKTGAGIEIPIDPALWISIKSMPKRNMAFLVTSRGLPFTANGFGNFFRKACDKAGLSKLSAHGLRKSMAVRLAESGATTNQIAAVTGHKSLSEVARYTAAAEKARLADQAFELLLETNKEQNVSQPSAWVGKKLGKDQ